MLPTVRDCPHCGQQALFAVSATGWRVRCAGSAVTAPCALNGIERHWMKTPEAAAFEWNHAVSEIKAAQRRRLYFP